MRRCDGRRTRQVVLVGSSAERRSRQPCETLADDGTLGLVGKVIDRRGKSVLRRIGSVALTAAGATVAYGVPGGDGVLGRAGDVAADQAGRQLERMGQQREWLQADKVVELRAGAPCVVYVSSDVVLPRESER